MSLLPSFLPPSLLPPYSVSPSLLLYSLPPSVPPPHTLVAIHKRESVLVESLCSLFVLLFVDCDPAGAFPRAGRASVAGNLGFQQRERFRSVSCFFLVAGERPERAAARQRGVMGGYKGETHPTANPASHHSPRLTRPTANPPAPAPTLSIPSTNTLQRLSVLLLPIATHPHACSYPYHSCQPIHTFPYLTPSPPTLHTPPVPPTPCQSAHGLWRICYAHVC